jgi:alpha-tubulin suppressor-like RCC1 family protein
MNKPNRVYAFGYNAFQQTSTTTQETMVKTPKCHTNVTNILFASWESTILLNGTSCLFLLLNLTFL